MKPSDVHPFFTVRRIDSSFRVVVCEGELEHTHRHPFPERSEALDLLTRVRQAVQHGRDLNLAHWETEIVC
jgi:hypothetical protein